MLAHAGILATLLFSGTFFLALSPLEAAGIPEERLIGWKGEVVDPESTFDPLNLSGSVGVSGIPLPASRAWVEHLSWQPRSFIYHNFITNEEAVHMIDEAAPTMKRSTVIGPNGKSIEDNYRTSYGTFLHRNQDEIIKRIENRVAAWTRIPVVHQEDTQILRYGIGQFYKVHGDTFLDKDAGARVATILIYLNEPDEGGETAFPDSTWIDPRMKEKHDPSFSDCAKGHVAFKPKRGDALLFWSIDPDGKREDTHAYHTGCPILGGVKWTATKWIHAKPFRSYEFNPGSFRKSAYSADPGICTDTNPHCVKKAANGECETKRDEMIVSAFAPGSCRKACGACLECTSGDVECFNQNRANVGYLVFNRSELNQY